MPADPTGRSPRIRPVPAVARTFAILRLLARSKRAMNLSEIATALDLVPSTCLHILRALMAEELIAVESGAKRYRIGAGLISLARGALEGDDFVAAVQGVIDRLSIEHNVTALAVRIHNISRMTVVALSRAASPFSLHVDIGSRFPALASATGRLVAAYADAGANELKAEFDRLRWSRRVAFPDWQRDVERTRRQGYGVDRGTFVDGITLVAVPFFDHAEHLTHTLVCADLGSRLRGRRLSELVRSMQDHTAQLEMQLNPAH